MNKPPRPPKPFVLFRPAAPAKRSVAPLPVLQPKAKAATQQPAVQRTARKPVAPPVYRPQPVPKVLQKKSVATQLPHTGQAPRQPVAPPVYRPAANKLVQPKAILQMRKSPKAPPVYRPKQEGIAQPEMASAAQIHLPQKAPPVYRPHPKSVITQATPLVQMKAQPVALSVYNAHPADDLQAKKTVSQLKQQLSTTERMPISKSFTLAPILNVVQLAEADGDWELVASKPSKSARKQKQIKAAKKEQKVRMTCKGHGCSKQDNGEWTRDKKGEVDGSSGEVSTVRGIMVRKLGDGHEYIKLLDRLNYHHRSAYVCAEPDAVSRLLDKGYSLSNIEIDNIQFDGAPAVPCGNCGSWLKEIRPGVYIIN